VSPAPKVDAACAAAVDVARAALLDGTAADEVGDHLGVAAEASEGARVVTHRFACRHPGYRGWSWAVTVARVPRARAVTVSEAVLLPGPDAVLAPPWVPWRDRLRPGDVGPGDVVVTEADDERLLPGYATADAGDGDEPGDVASLAAELGLGRARVLSPEGRDDAAQRWYEGAGGPAAPEARTAPEPCATCGFYVRLAGPLGAAFGVCSNAMSPSDGHVVSVDHGCGAHSEIVLAAAAAAPPPVLDTLGHDSLVGVEPAT
jgi:hypothetical protein